MQVLYVGVVGHDQVCHQVSQGFRCRDSLTHKLRHRSSGDKLVECVVQANRCLTSCGETPQSVQMSLGSPNTLCL